MISNAKRTRILLATATAALSTTMMSGAAWADCVNQAPAFPLQVVCGNIGTLGYNGSAINGLSVVVNSGAVVSTLPPPGTPTTPLISTGTGSSVVNFGGNYNNNVGPVSGINAGSATNPAISVGGGSTITNASNAYMIGSIAFGASGTGTNTLNNNYSIGSGSTNLIGAISGNITSIGNTAITNQGVIGLGGGGDITQTGAGTVLITNGVAPNGWTTTLIDSFNTYKNPIIGGNINTVGDTTLNNLAGPANSFFSGNASTGAIISGDVTVGTGHAGTSTINNSGTIFGNVTMSDATNVFNAGTLGSSTVNSGTLPYGGNTSFFSPVGSGTLTGISGGNNTLNLNGTAQTHVLQATVSNFGVVNVNDGGKWTLSATLAGNNSGAITNINTNGTLSTDSAAYLGGNTVNLGTGSTLIFNGTTAATFSGTIQNLGTATNGKVIIGTGTAITTFSGTNTYTGGTTIDAGKLIVTGGSALADTGAVVIKNGGLLGVSGSETIGNLSDAGTGTNIVSIASGQTLTVASGNFGSIAGDQIQGAGGLTKATTGTLTLSGTNTFSGPLTVNNGIVAISGGTAIADGTAVIVNYTPASGLTPAQTGELDVNSSETIGSLDGAGANAIVKIASGQALTTGGANGVHSYAGQITGAGALNLVGTSTFTLLGANTYSGGTNVTGGILQGFAGSLQGNILDSTTVIFDQSLTGAPASGTYGGNITGAGNLTFRNGGTVMLTGTNSGFSGTTNILGGTASNTTVSIANAGNIGTGTLTLDKGTLETSGVGPTLGNAITLGAGGGTMQVDGTAYTILSGAIIGSGQLTKTGSGILGLNGANNYTGGTLVSAGTINGTAGNGIVGAYTNNAAVHFTGTGTYTGAMTGTGTVQISSGITTFANPTSGSTTYSGATTIDSTGTLSATTLLTLSANSAIIDNGALVTTARQSIGSLAGTGTVNTNGSTLDTGFDNTSTTFSGNFLSGTAVVDKVGTGTFTLSGNANNMTTFNVNAGAVDLTGALTNTATNVNSGGTLFVDGTLTSPTVTVASGGTLKGGVGTTPGVIKGNVTNNGTVQPGHSPGIINQATGNYVQTGTGTFLVNVNGTAAAPVAGIDFGQYNVQAGTATLAGALTIVQNPLTLYKAGTVYSIITTTGGVVADFTTFNNLTISPFVSFAHAVVGNNYNLTVVRANYNTVATTPNQIAVANGLQGLVPPGDLSVAAANAVIAIDNMTAAQAQVLFNQASPEVYGSYATALQDQGELFTRQVAGQLSSERLGKKAGLWINAYGAWGKGSTNALQFGSDQNTTGFAAGVDTEMGNLTLGLAAGYSEDKLTYRLGNSSGKDKSWQFGGYAAYNAGKLSADLQLAYVSGDITATKSIVAGTINATTAAATKGHLFRAVGTVGYDVSSSNLKFKPFIGIDFSSGHINGFTETGATGNATALNLTVSQISTNKTDVMAGFKLSSKMGALTPYLNATYRYRLDSAVSPVSALFNGNPGTNFTVSALAPSKSQGDVDAGVNLSVGKSATVFVGYEGTFRSDVTSHGVNGGVRVSF